MKHTHILHFSSVLLYATVLVSAQTAPQVHLGQTTVSGKLSDTSSSVETFLGIPFAEAPTGPLRLKPPVLRTNLNTSAFNATAYGLPCIQAPTFSNVTSEDCLSINIFRPTALNANASLPVMVYFYGSGFTAGSADPLLYDGTSLVNTSMRRDTPIIYVNFNYRVGPLGFPAGKEAAQRGALNLGLKDQLVALQWVQANIDAFGGDKSKVTVFGGSAGACSIDYHLFGDKLKSLARAAILQSDVRFSQFGPDLAEPNWHAFVGAIPACASTANSSDTFACLQSDNTNITAQMLIEASATVQGTDSPLFGLPFIGPFIPVLDGGSESAVVPDFPSRMEVGSPLALMLGSNVDEGTLFTHQNVSSADEISAFIIKSATPSPKGADALANASREILELYRDDPALGAPFGTGNDTFGLSKEYKRYAAVLGDLFFQSARRTLSKRWNELGSAPVYVYHFSDPDANLPLLLPWPAAPGSIGPTHTFELPYVFGTEAVFNITSESAVRLGAMMQEYWISFATSLDPNDGRGIERPQWKKYVPGVENVMQLNGKNLSMIPDTYREAQIAFFDEDPILFRR